MVQDEGTKLIELSTQLRAFGKTTGVKFAAALTDGLPQDAADRFDKTLSEPYDHEKPYAQFEVLVGAFEALLPRRVQIDPCLACILLGNMAAVLVDIYFKDRSDLKVTVDRLLQHTLEDHVVLEDEERAAPNIRVLELSNKEDLNALLKSLFQEKSDDDKSSS